MSDHSDNEGLLGDILTEELPAGFREALLQDTLRLVRHRRRAREVRKVVSAMALMLVACLGVWRVVTPLGRSPEASKAYLILRTQPLPAQAIIQSHPLPTTDVVASRPLDSVLTTATAGYQAREISDDELLALAKPNAVILVRYSPHQAELMFANSSTVP